MKPVFGLALLCLVSVFAIGCEPKVANEVGAGTEPPANVAAQQQAYSESAQKQTPNAQK